MIPWQPISGPLCYLASPFSLYPHGRERAIDDICAIAVRLITTGVRLFCPIAHSAPLVKAGIPPLDLSLWEQINAPFLNVCSILIVARMDGWQDSSGIAGEVEHFNKVGKPIFDLDPVSLMMTRRRSESV